MRFTDASLPPVLVICGEENTATPTCEANFGDEEELLTDICEAIFEEELLLLAETVGIELFDVIPPAAPIRSAKGLLVQAPNVLVDEAVVGVNWPIGCKLCIPELMVVIPVLVDEAAASWPSFCM